MERLRGWRSVLESDLERGSIQFRDWMVWNWEMLDQLSLIEV